MFKARLLTIINKSQIICNSTQLKQATDSGLLLEMLCAVYSSFAQNALQSVKLKYTQLYGFSYQRKQSTHITLPIIENSSLTSCSICDAILDSLSFREFAVAT